MSEETKTLFLTSDGQLCVDIHRFVSSETNWISRMAFHISFSITSQRRVTGIWQCLHL